MNDYLAALAPLLARATLGESILADLGAIERLFGHTWLIDPAPFEEALAAWRTFKAEYEKRSVAGMTVNERLHALGLLEAFDQARASRDAAMMTSLLRRAHVDEPSIRQILEEP